MLRFGKGIPRAAKIHTHENELGEFVWMSGIGCRKQQQDGLLLDFESGHFAAIDGATKRGGVAMKIIRKQLRKGDLEDYPALLKSVRDKLSRTSGIACLSSILVDTTENRVQQCLVGDCVIEDKNGISVPQNGIEYYKAGRRDLKVMIRARFGPNMDYEEGIEKLETEVANWLGGGENSEGLMPDHYQESSYQSGDVVRLKTDGVFDEFGADEDSRLFQEAGELYQYADWVQQVIRHKTLGTPIEQKIIDIATDGTGIFEKEAKGDNYTMLALKFK